MPHDVAGSAAGPVRDPAHAVRAHGPGRELPVGEPEQMVNVGGARDLDAPVARVPAVVPPTGEHGEGIGATTGGLDLKKQWRRAGEGARDVRPCPTRLLLVLAVAILGCATWLDVDAQRDRLAGRQDQIV